MTGAHIAAGQMHWLVRKGDLILSDKPQTIYHSVTEQFTEASQKDRKVTIWSYDDHDHLPTKIKGAVSGE